MYRCSIVACARWEVNYVFEWLEYHSEIGFDHVFLYINDDDATEMLAEAYRYEKVRPGFLTVVHFPGQGRQRDMYLAALPLARDTSEWIMFLDLDEFLVLPGCDDVQSYLSAFPPAVDSIHFNWLNFGNSGFATRPAGSVLAQYTKRAARLHSNTKHLTRSAKLSPGRVREAVYPFWHALPDPFWSDLHRVNVLGEPFVNTAEGAWPQLDIVREGTPASQAAIARGRINHYMMKSEADFLLRVQRGTAADFSGQVVWKNESDAGNTGAILQQLGAVEDRYLAGFRQRRMAAPQAPAAAPADRSEPAPPTRTIVAHHPLWTAELVLGSNGRLRHVSHGSLASYTSDANILRVDWDLYPQTVFTARDGAFHANDVGPAARQNPRAGDREYIYLREIIRGITDLRQTLGLEVGPFDRPLFSKDEAHVEYLDYRSTQELREFAAQAPGHSPDFVVDVDYVDSGSGDWRDVPMRRFDWIISAHALEHTPNLIKFIETMASKLKPGGLIISILPDKRATFDAFRPLTSLGRILEDYMVDARVPRQQAVFDGLFYARSLSIADAGIYSASGEDLLVNNDNFLQAFAAARASASTYHDTHNYVFTSQTFYENMRHLVVGKVLNMDCPVHLHTRPGEMSFTNVLRLKP